MPCVDLGLTIPTVPDLFLPNAGFNVSIPDISIDVPCCKFDIPIPGLNAAIAAANVLITQALAFGGAPLMAAVMTANEIIAQAQAEINKIRIRIPECPND